MSDAVKLKPFKLRRYGPIGSWTNCSVAQLCMVSALILLSSPDNADESPYATHELMSLSLEELASIEISCSGASGLPEVLRLAPNLLIARRDANNYAISARGFNSGTAN